MILNQRISPSLSEKQPCQQARVCLQKGFTLVELMMVLAVLGALIAVAVPYLKESRDHSAVNNATVVLHNKLKQARSLAVAGGRTVAVSIPSSTSITYDAYSAGCAECVDQTIDLTSYSPSLRVVTNQALYKFQSNGIGMNATYRIKLDGYYKCITLNQVGRAYIGLTATCTGL